jgi:hypothetical protein
MDWKQYDRLETGSKIRQEIRRDKVLTVKTYDGSKLRTKDKTWSVSEFVRDDLMSRSAFVARCMLFGKTEKGKDDINARGANAPVSQKVQVKLQVLSRQGCQKDADGNEINVRPKDLEYCTEPTESPVPGDFVIVRQGMKEINDEDKPLSGADRNGMLLSGESIYHENEYEVDEDLCIDVSLEDAFTLLGKSGKGIVMPEFKPLLQNLNREEKKFERRISNWLYKEVGQDFKLKKQSKQKDK